MTANIMPTPFPADTAQEANALLSRLNRPDGTGWADHPELFNKMADANGNPSLPIAACPTHGILDQVSKGFLSFPQGWAGGLIQITMLAGTFGEVQKRHAVLRNHVLHSVISMALQDLERTGRVLKWIAINVLPKDAAFIAARFGGAAFTAYALRLRKLNDTARYGGLGLNFILASYGSAILGIAKGDRQLHAIAYSILSGRYDGLCVPVDKMERELKDMDIKDTGPMVDALKGILNFAQDAETQGTEKH
ncbi:hypothetical protein [Nitrospirillum iridis]|uniref:Uncharacterized protein n=1 Tax=Nitrospirillum iridis TaxID=765888 RepID=A0A7X0AVN2_9PROT|nr:hypothetical protein [Nitrospirillum iridis]MBB6249519.1 hypothetical protein [Nitrospirillum iridis]